MLGTQPKTQTHTRTHTQTHTGRERKRERVRPRDSEKARVVLHTARGTHTPERKLIHNRGTLQGEIVEFSDPCLLSESMPSLEYANVFCRPCSNHMCLA